MNGILLEWRRGDLRTHWTSQCIYIGRDPLLIPIPIEMKERITILLWINSLSSKAVQMKMYESICQYKIGATYPVMQQLCYWHISYASSYLQRPTRWCKTTTYSDHSDLSTQRFYCWKSPSLRPPMLRNQTRFWIIWIKTPDAMRRCGYNDGYVVIIMVMWLW